MTTGMWRSLHARRKFGQISVSAMITICGSTRPSVRATQNGRINREIEGVIDDVGPHPSKLLTGVCRGGHDDRFSGELASQLFDQNLGCLYLAHRNRMDPNGT